MRKASFDRNSFVPECNEHVLILSHSILLTGSLGYGCNLNHRRTQIIIVLVLYTMVRTWAASFSLVCQRERIVVLGCCGGCG